MEQMRARAVKIDASFFDCAFCGKPLKPPSFMCDAGHFVCQHCCDGHLQVCADAVNKQLRIPSPGMDRTLRAAMVSCVHKVDGFGCPVRVAYHELADHVRSCDYVPCKCPFSSCDFLYSPAHLFSHWSRHHRCSVVCNYVYGQPQKLDVSGNKVMAALTDEAQRCVFAVHSSPLRGNRARLVSVALMRASEDAPAVACQFRCHLWMNGVGSQQAPVISFRVPCSDGSGLAVKPQGLLPYLELPVEAAALMIRIDKDGDQAGSGDEEDRGIKKQRLDAGFSDEEDEICI